MDEKERWENYRKANSSYPQVRAIELNKIIKFVDAKQGETILECGTGNGYLTIPLAKSVGKNGTLISYDVTKENLEYVEYLNKDLKLNIITKEQPRNYIFSEKDNSINKIVSIATMHHYDNRDKKTGHSGKLQAMQEFSRVLKSGGKVIIGDVANNTDSQRYFDAINNPQYCYPTGHPHDFFDLNLAKKLCKLSGLKFISFKIYSTPWVFKDDKEAMDFLHTIHNAKCSAEESFEIAKKYLKYTKLNNKVKLGWKLGYFIAEKR